MAIPRRTLGVLAAVAAPLGTLGLAASAHATTPAGSGLTITSPAPDDNGLGYTNTTDPTITFSGANPDQTVMVGTDSNPDLASVTAGADGTGSLHVGTAWLSPGDNNEVEVTEPDASETITENLHDGDIPEIALSDPGSNDRVDEGDTAAYGAYFSATGDTVGNEKIALFLDGDSTPDATATTDSADSFDGDNPASDIVPTGGLTPGYHTAVLKSEDADGNFSAASDTLHFYVAPPAPSFVTPAPAAIDPYLSHSKPTFTVSGVEAGATVDVYLTNDDGSQTLIGTTPSPDGGNHVQVTADTAVPDGAHGFTVTQTVPELDTDTDTTQNVTSFSDDYQPSRTDLTTAEVDTTPPGLFDDFELYAGSLTNESRPSFRINTSVYAPGTQWRLYDDTGDIVGQAGIADAITPSAALADGNYSYYAVLIDSTGEESAHSTPLDFTVDTTPPSVPAITSPAAGSIVTTTEPSITIHGDPGTYLSATIDGNTRHEVDLYGQTAGSNGSTTYRLSTPLSAGQHTLSVYSVDKAENVSWSKTITFTVKTAGTTAVASTTGGGTTTPTTPVTTPTATPAPKPTPTHKPTPAPKAPKAVKLSSHTLRAGHPVKVGFKVSRPTTVVLTLSKKVHKKVKVKVHGKRRTITKTVFETVGKVSVKVKKAGKRSFTLTNRFGGHKLAKGSYTLAVRATRGKKASKAVTTKLNVR